MAENGFRNLLWFMGVVEDRRDPKKMGRLRIRCFDIHPDSKEDVPTETLPWAIPVIGSYDFNYKPPIEGSWVFGFFLDGDDAQHPMVLGVMPGMPTTFPNSTQGFNGKSDIYPKPHDAYNPDVNRLARGEEIDKTHVATQHATKDSIEPRPPYNAQYPYNKVQETESGHVFEMDDSPASERINIRHRKGTYLEVGPTGTQTNKIVGDGVTIIERNGKVLIKGASEVTIRGKSNIKVESDCNLTVDGTMTTNVHGDYRLNVGGGIYMNSGDIFSQKSSSIRQEAYLDSYNLFARQHIVSQSEIGNIHVYANTGFISAYANTDVRIENGGNTYFNTTGQYNIKSANNIAIEGAKIDLNTSGAVKVDPGYTIYVKGTLTDFASPSGKRDSLRTGLGKPIENDFPIDFTYDDTSYSSIADEPDPEHAHPDAEGI